MLDTVTRKTKANGRIPLGRIPTARKITVRESAFTIEDNIPLPKARGGRSSQHGYPFAQLKIGQSFVIPLKPGEATNVAQRRVTNAACSSGRTHGRKFATRVVEGGIRVWRVK